MTGPETAGRPAPDEIDPLQTSDIGKDKANHPPIPYNGPIGGMGADADTAPPPATAGMGADAMTGKADGPDKESQE